MARIVIYAIYYKKDVWIYHADKIMPDGSVWHKILLDMPKSDWKTLLREFRKQSWK